MGVKEFVAPGCESKCKCRFQEQIHLLVFSPHLFLIPHIWCEFERTWSKTISLFGYEDSYFHFRYERIWTNLLISSQQNTNKMEFSSEWLAIDFRCNMPEAAKQFIHRRLLIIVHPAFLPISSWMVRFNYYCLLNGYTFFSVAFLLIVVLFSLRVSLTHGCIWLRTGILLLSYYKIKVHR